MKEHNFMTEVLTLTLIFNHMEKQNKTEVNDRTNKKLIEQLKHRLAMISEDEKQIRKFINTNKLSKAFEEPTEVSDEAWHLLNNIEIACDLSNDESLTWTSNSK